MVFFKVLGRILGGFFKGIGQGFMGLFRWIARHEAFLGVVTVVVLAVAAVWIVLNALNINIVVGQPQSVVVQAVATEAPPQPSPTAAPPPTAIPVSRNNAPASTEAFMIGQINGNADQVWNAMAANLHTQLAGEGRDKTYFQRLFDSQKKNGLVYEGYQYVGGVPGENGNSVHFYVLKVVGSDKRTSTVPWTFVVDKEGKIAITDFPS